MANPDLYDDLAKKLIAGFDAGEIYPAIDDEKGLVWRAATAGGMDDALPRDQILISSVIQAFITDTGGEAHWENRSGEWGIVFHDENEFIPLSDLAVNKRLGFYKISLFPDVINDAGGY